jgi:hypothetical protein
MKGCPNYLLPAVGVRFGLGDTAVALVSVSLLCDRTEVGAISEIIVSALIR